MTRKLFDPVKKVGPRIAVALLKRGVIGCATPQGGILDLASPLCLSRGEADVVKAAATAVKEVTAGFGGSMFLARVGWC